MANTDVMGRRFDVLVTADNNLRFQQDLRTRPFAVAVLRAKSNHIRDLLPLVPELLAALPALRLARLLIQHNRAEYQEAVNLTKEPSSQAHFPIWKVSCAKSRNFPQLEPPHPKSI